MDRLVCLRGSVEEFLEKSTCFLCVAGAFGWGRLWLQGFASLKRATCGASTGEGRLGGGGVERHGEEVVNHAW